MKKPTTIAIAGAVCFGAASLHATTLWDVDFDSSTTGSQPSTSAATPSIINTQPTDVGASGGTGANTNEVVVESSFSVGIETMSTQPVIMRYLTTGSGTNVSMDFEGTPADFTAPAPFTLGFDFLIDALGNASNTLELTARNENGDRIIRALFKGNGDIKLLNDFGVNEDLSGAWSPGEIHNFEGVMDAANNSFTVSIDGTVTGSVPLGITDPAARGLDRFRFQRGSSAVDWEGSFDDIQVTAIPELNQVGLSIGIFTAVFLVMRRNR